MNSKSQIKVPFHNCRAAIDQNSFNEKDNSIEVVFATETPVRRFNWLEDRTYDEVLRISSDAVDLTRLNTGASVLNSHNNYELDSVLGIVERAWIDEASKEARAKIRLSDEPADATIVNKIKKGIIRSLSAGYNIQSYEVSEEDGQTPTYTATRWEPMEISFVPVPADYNSKVRSKENEPATTADIVYTNNKKTEMEKEKEVVTKEDTTQTRTVEQPVKKEVETPLKETVQPNEMEIRTAAVQEERKRVSDITDSCKRAGLPVEFSEILIKEGKNINEAREAIIDEVAKRANPAPTGHGASVNGLDEAEQTRTAIIDGISERMKPGSIKDFGQKEKAKQYRRMRMLDLAKDRLRSKGERFQNLSDEEIVKRAITTTDYPDLLTTSVQRTLRRDFANQVQPWQLIARRERANDFRVKTGIKIDGSSKFEEIPESGKYRTSPVIQDEKATIKLKRFGQAHIISYEAIINDDLGALARIPRIIGVDAQKFQSDKIWGLLINNSSAPDGNPLFDKTNHKNYDSTGTAISETSLSAGRTALRKMKSPAGNIIGVAPRYLIVPPELETIAQKLVASVMATATGDVNVFAGTLEVLVCNTLTDATAWYLAADPDVITADGLVYAYLDGQEGVATDSFVDPYSDALVIKASMAFDAAVWGWQGWYKNKGA